MKRPLTLTIAVALQWVAAVLAIVSGFDLALAAFEMRRDDVALQLEAALVNAGIVDLAGSTVVSAVLVLGVLLIVIAFVRVMAAVYLARGRAWARILVAVFVVVNLISGLAFLFQGEWLRAVAGIVVEVVVLWLLFNARSTAYIRHRTEEDAAEALL